MPSQIRRSLIGSRSGSESDGIGHRHIGDIAIRVPIPMLPDADPDAPSPPKAGRGLDHELSSSAETAEDRGTAGVRNPGEPGVDRRGTAEAQRS